MGGTELRVDVAERQGLGQISPCEVCTAGAPEMGANYTENVAKWAKNTTENSMDACRKTRVPNQPCTH